MYVLEQIGGNPLLQQRPFTVPEDEASSYTDITPVPSVPTLGNIRVTPAPAGQWSNQTTTFNSIGALPLGVYWAEEEDYTADLKQGRSPLYVTCITHEWVDTGFRKSWCRHCNSDKPD